MIDFAQYAGDRQILASCAFAAIVRSAPDNGLVDLIFSDGQEQKGLNPLDPDCPVRMTEAKPVWTPPPFQAQRTRGKR